jgi:integrase
MYLDPKLGTLRLGDLRGQHITRAYAEVMAERRAAIEQAQARNEQHRRAANEWNAAHPGSRPKAPHQVAIPPTVSPVTVRRIHAVEFGALKSAVKAGLVPRSVAPDVELPKATKHKVRPWTPAEYGRFLDYVERTAPRWYPFVLLAGHSGLRRGELLGLRWSDLDSSTGRLVVARQRISVGYQVREGDNTKTDAGQRVVVLDAGTVAALRAWRKTQLEERLAWGAAYQDRGGLLFTHEDGRPLHPDHVSKVFRRLVTRAGLPAAKLHALRQYHAAALISTGADIAAVSKLLGHSSIAITSDIYGGLFEQASAELSERAAGLVPRERHA